MKKEFMQTPAIPAEFPGLGLHVCDVEVQHTRLEQLLQELVQLLRSRNVAIAAVRCAFDRLVEYTRLHFSDEEQFMQQQGFPESLLESHRLAHEGFLTRLMAAHTQVFGVSESPDATGIEAMVVDWFEVHRANEDQAYLDYFHHKFN